jgi:hypothetical protein
MKRWEVRIGSQSSHCCFEATVVDVTKPHIIGGEQYEDHCEPICECFSVEQAEQIAAALNAYESNA